MTKPFIKENFKDPTFTRFQQNLAKVIDPLRTGIWGDGNLVQGIPVTAGQFVIVDTGLPQAYQGWVIVRPRCTYEDAFRTFGPCLIEIIPPDACVPETWDPTRQCLFISMHTGLLDVWFY